MATVDNSSSSSTSHTLTALPIPATMPSRSASFLDNLQPSNRHVFLQPSASVPTQSLGLVRDTLEAFAGDVADEQAQRLKKNKRKRGEEKSEVLKVRRVHVEGFETEQVWQQAKRVIEGVLRHADTVLDELQDEGLVAVPGEEDEQPQIEELDSEDAEDEESGDFDEEDDEGDVEVDEDMLDLEAVSDDDEEGHFDDEQDDYNEDEEEGSEDDGDEDEEEAGEFVEDPDGLNDGFFDLDAFNRESQWFEKQDAKGDPTTDQASDDEEIDWDADITIPGFDSAKPASKAATSGPNAEEDSDDDDDGPTFGDMVLDAPDSDDDEDIGDLADGVDDGNGDLGDAVMYRDFFAPPQKKASGKPKSFKKSVHFEQPAEEDVNRAMADVKRDLFDDDSDDGLESGDALSDVEAGDPKARRSAHERRQAKLAEEIRKLEAASVAKREWAMSGEAAAVDRPSNSLLEKDLDFEHGGKPVPVITPEVNETIEDLIKRRILTQEFDEVVRRRPGTESNTNGNARRGLLEELDDTKGKGLAEVCEEEHAKQQNPDTYMSASDEKLQREEKEIEAMWRSVSGRLDALSSWHYTPKPVEPTLNIVSDVATIAMEDAQPTTSAGMAGESSRMAPQEVYTSNKKNASKGEVVSKSGLPMAKQELSKEDKDRRRRREKERVRKAGGVGKTLSKRAKMQKDTMDDLKKGGVKVVNRKGEVTDVQGNKVKNAKTASSGSYKL